MTSTEPTTEDSQALCPKCKGTLASPDQPCPWCIITASPTIPVSRATKPISRLEWVLGIGGTLLIAATLLIPKFAHVVSQESLGYQWFTDLTAMLGAALLSVAFLKHVKRAE